MADSLKSRWYQLDFAVSRSLRYHAKRRRFFETCGQLVRVTTAIAGAGTCAAVFGAASKYTVGFGILVGLAAAIDLVFEFGRHAMTHDHLYRCFADLSAEIVEADQTSEAGYKKIQAKIKKIEGDEPTGLDVLNVIVSNEVREALGYDYKYKVGYLQTLLSQFGDFGKQDFPKVPNKIPSKLNDAPPSKSVH